MPRSKRDKKVSLTVTKKKGSKLKERLFEEIRKSVDSYERVFTFSVQNMRNNKLKDVRQHWHTSRFFFGKNKVMSMALGRSSSDECASNVHKIGKKLSGQMGLLFTNSSETEVLDWFSDYKEKDFARAGNKATQTVKVKAEPLEAFPHSMEPQLRQLGLPTTLQKGIITLTKEYRICKKDDVLTPEQARILKLFGFKMATFRLTIENMWSKSDGKFRKFTSDKKSGESVDSCSSSFPLSSSCTVYIKPESCELMSEELAAAGDKKKRSSSKKQKNIKPSNSDDSDNNDDEDMNDNDEADMSDDDED